MAIETCCNTLAQVALARIFSVYVYYSTSYTILTHCVGEWALLMEFRLGEKVAGSIPDPDPRWLVLERGT